MSATISNSTITVALVGNPNTGKSTLFNALAGVRQRVGNYPGVTVEKKIGRMDHSGHRFTLIDLPGTYSLAARSPDEMIAVDVLMGRREDVDPPDVVLCIVDASNLERNLYLVSQVLELGRPTVVALNMMDMATGQGLSIDVERLERQLGIAIVPMQANRKLGLADVKGALAAAVDAEVAEPASPFPEPFCREVDDLQSRLGGQNDGDRLPRYLVERLLLDTSGYLQQAALPTADGDLRDQLSAARERLSDAGLPVPAVEAMARYEWAGQVLEGVVTRPATKKITRGDRLDAVLTHWLWGSLSFIALMIVVFQSVFSWAEWGIVWSESAFEALGGLAAGALPAGALRSLVVDGVIAGVGNVLVFLPQIFILFFFIAVLEDCGYMARAAYLMDMLMSRVGLSGKSFIPLLSSFACAIPGIMAARVIEDRRDRLVTILVAPLMSCSARLPVYTVLIAAFIPSTSYLGGLLSLKGITMFSMYMVGIVTAVCVALVLKTTILKGATPPFVMELPSYKLPSLRMVAFRVLDRGWAFVRRAGTLILAVSVLVWAAGYYPHNAQQVEAPYRDELSRLDDQISQLQEPVDDAAPLAAGDSAASFESLVARRSQLRNEIAGSYMRHSVLGRMGQFVEPVVKPLGWDWRIGCAVIASFPARELVVGTLGVIYNLGEDYDPDAESGGGKTDPLREKLQNARWEGSDRAVYNVPVALSIMVFFALCAQCAATLVVIKRETNSWRWPLFTFSYMTGLAYLGALATYRIGMLFVA